MASSQSSAAGGRAKWTPQKCCDCQPHHYHSVKIVWEKVPLEDGTLFALISGRIVAVCLSLGISEKAIADNNIGGRLSLSHSVVEVGRLGEGAFRSTYLLCGICRSISTAPTAATTSA